MKTPNIIELPRTANGGSQQRVVGRRVQMLINWIAAPYVIPVSVVKCCMMNLPIDEVWVGIGEYLRGEW